MRAIARIGQGYIQFLYRIFTGSVRSLLVLALVGGILAPRMFVVIADLVPGVQQMVICTGHGIEIWTIGPDGVPVEEPETIEHRCIMTDGVTFVADVPLFWQLLAQNYAHSFVVRENTRPVQALPTRPGLTRGPPVFV